MNIELVGGFNPFSKILVKLEIFPNFWGKNKKCLKPPPSEPEKPLLTVFLAHHSSRLLEGATSTSQLLRVSYCWWWFRNPANLTCWGTGSCLSPLFCGGFSTIHPNGGWLTLGVLNHQQYLFQLWGFQDPHLSIAASAGLVEAKHLEKSSPRRTDGRTFVSFGLDVSPWSTRFVC